MEIDVRISALGTLTEYLAFDAECANDRGRRSLNGMYVVVISITRERRTATGWIS